MAGSNRRLEGSARSASAFSRRRRPGSSLASGHPGKVSLPFRRHCWNPRQPNVLMPSRMRHEVPLAGLEVLPGRDRCEALYGRESEIVRELDGIRSVLPEEDLFSVNSTITGSSATLANSAPDSLAATTRELFNSLQASSSGQAYSGILSGTASPR